MRNCSYILIVLALMLLASPASAAQPLTIAQFWVGFRNYWGGVFASIGGVIGMALATGAIAVFIITRGKWYK